MRSHVRRVCFASITIVLLFTLLRSGLALPQNGGSFQLTVHASGGSATLSGKLENVIIQPNNIISLIMVGDQMQISAPSGLGISGLHQSNFTGTLNGMRNGSILSGQIQNLAGKACINACFNLAFVGEGQWSGTLSQTHANGTLQGTITITDAPTSEIPTGRALSFSGTWTADF